VYELLTVDKEIRRLILNDASTEEIEAKAVEQGMLTLESYGRNLVLEKLSTLEELQRVCSGEKD